MKTILIYTVGTRDLLFKESVINNTLAMAVLPELGVLKPREGTLLPPARKAAKVVSENYQLFQPYLVFPMLPKIVAYVKERQGHIDQLYLVVTDQSDDSAVAQRLIDNDTLNFALIVNKLFSDNDVKSILRITVKDHVVNIDENYKFFHQKFKSIIKAEKGDKLFVCCQGGIDQINTGILIAALDAFPDSINIHLSENTGTVSRNSFPQTYQVNQARGKLRLLLSQYNFEAAKTEDYFKNKSLSILLEIGAHRQNLETQQALQKLYILADELDTAFGHEYSKIIASIKAPFLALQREDWELAKLDYKLDKLNLFLIRVFTITETFYQDILIKEFAFEFGYEQGREQKSWTDFLNHINSLNPKRLGVWELLNTHKLKNDAPNQLAFFRIIKEYLPDAFLKLNVHKINDRTKKLRDLRNKIAHGHKSLIKQDLIKAVGGQDEMDELFLILDAVLGCYPNSFDFLTKRILELAEKAT